jgi:GNAT superfamily N-acetyltransferase
VLANTEIIITKAEETDLPQILELQYLAYQSKAIRHDDFSIQPLRQTIEELILEYKKGTVLKAVDESGELVGSVRAYAENGTAYIGKLIVTPSMQGQGIGTRLMKAIEQEYIGMRFELFTGYKSARTIGLYEHLGYVRFKEKKLSDKLTLVFFEKIQ